MEAETDFRPLRVLRTFSVPKREDTPNEDRRCVSADAMTCAVSDGASVSFDSGPWAEILARRFVENPDISRDWIRAAINEYRTAYDREAMSWSGQAAFDRGSFATLLGVVCSPEGRGVRVFAFGDTLLAFVENGELVRTIPYVQVEDFDRSPDLISSNPLENRSLDEDAISASWHDLTIGSQEATALLVVTDAIGRWLLDQEKPTRAKRLLDICDPDAFVTFVESERADGRMKRDDSTLVVIGL
jgi:hypothetical protein